MNIKELPTDEDIVDSVEKRSKFKLDLGNLDSDVDEIWIDGAIWMRDNYCVPLLEKLKENDRLKSQLAIAKEALRFCASPGGSYSDRNKSREALEQIQALEPKTEGEE